MLYFCMFWELFHVIRGEGGYWVCLLGVFCWFGDGFDGGFFGGVLVGFRFIFACIWVYNNLKEDEIIYI
jgi:hypothetical protein